MKKTFEIGKTYKCIDTRMTPITVFDRKKMTIMVKNNKYGEYSMRVHNDYEHEYVVDDKHVSSNLRGLFCYIADSEIEG